MKRIIIAVAVIAAGIAAVAFIQQLPTTAAGKAGIYKIVFKPRPPIDLDPYVLEEDLISFAWNEFFALNWKASPYNRTRKRDSADYSWNYSTPEPFPDQVVWETYAHRTELRPYSDYMGPFDQPPNYSYKYNIPTAPGASRYLFNNLDENNEIGSCDIYAHVGQQQPYNKQTQVLYQAKVNRDEYEYIAKWFPKKALLDSATARNVRYISSDSLYRPGLGQNCDCPTSKADTVLCLPCGGAPNRINGGIYTGAIEVKTAWRQLTLNDDSTRFFRRTVITYEWQGKQLTLVNKVYALIGLHIIHKTANYPNFIFATFEQVDVDDTNRSNMGYDTVLDQTGTTTLTANYKRLHPINQKVMKGTQAAHELLKQQNPNSIWQYYRLVGVQGRPTSDSTTPSYFLANYVVESDYALAQFRGSSLGHPHDGKVNTLVFDNFFRLKRGNGVVMGGCQGCHGASQIRLGTDASFLLDDVGKPVDTPDPGLRSSKLQKYIEAFRKVDEADRERLKTAMRSKITNR